MDFQQFATSGLGTRLWMGLGQMLPPRTGRGLARAVSNVLCRRQHSSLYRTLFANQSIILGPGAGPEKVHARVHAVLQHAGMVSYDLMHVIGKGEKAIQTGIEFDSSVWADIEAARAGGRGVMFCGAHLSNFNLAFLWFALNGVPLQVLSTPLAAEGFRLITALRARGLLTETPINSGALRNAVSRLREGGLVLTGCDWPLLPWEEDRVPFFGIPARLPTGHIRLAMMANARLLPVRVVWDPHQGYSVRTAAPIEIRCTGNRAEDVRHNALRVLSVLEKWIVEHPEQWLMYHPVWEQNVTPDAAT